MTRAGNVAVYHGEPNAPEYRDFICKTLKNAKQLSSATRTMVAMNSRDDDLFVSLIGPHEVLWFNATDHELSAGGRTSRHVRSHGRDLSPDNSPAAGKPPLDLYITSNFNGRTA